MHQKNRPRELGLAGRLRRILLNWIVLWVDYIVTLVKQGTRSRVILTGWQAACTVNLAGSKSGINEVYKLDGFSVY